MKVQVLVGPIASGKSTFSTKRAREGAIIINDDALVMALHGGDYSLYNDGLKPLYKKLDIDILTMALAHSLDVVVDRTNLQKHTRQRWYSIAKVFGAESEVVIFPNEGPEVHAERRAASDDRGMSKLKWLAVAKRHQAELEPVVFGEGFDVMSVYKWATTGETVAA